MRLKHFVVILVIVILPLTFSFTSKKFAENVRLFSYQLIKPVLQVTHQLSGYFKSGIDEAKGIHKVYQENKNLVKQLAEERNKTVIETEVLQENARLRKLLGFKKEIVHEVVPAQIIARDISFWSRWIVLDKGSNDGVRPGMVLVNDQGLAGRVISAGAHVSRAILIIDGESRVSVIVQTTRDTGLLEGRGDESPLVKLLPLGSTVKPGDAVITSGLGGAYPKGLPIGYVETIREDKDGLHLVATVKPFVDFNKIEEVLCLSASDRN